ncbi:hypothetical protein DBT_0216 [Dissulfuribacter thermophilus]|uniref:Uncharacterized protein n=1 Tax=Dissulfuribacter thermophilus TaxID=1156395 RepID=A0A1B9F8Z7_9BACT|nr:DsrE family protein [Dissulfuribacter thermophilus]OCC16399.1 hypothetical protein DBT_0216 [Dissulfuribacter thermophilus]
MKTKVVFHVNRDDQESLLIALGNMENLLKVVPPEEAGVYLLSNGKSVKLFQRDRASEYASTVKSLSEKGVHFLVCNNSLNKFGIKPDELIEVCEVVPAGIVELIKLQSEGCAYVKP